jgi:competence protein ComEC
MGVAVPVGFLAVFTGWNWLGQVAGWMLSLSRVIVEWHANVEPNWRIPSPPFWLGAVFAGALIACAIASGRWWRLASGTVLAAALTILLCHPFPPMQRRGQLEMTAIDVGQGDSILVVFPDGKRLLMDGGGIPAFGNRARAQLDIGEDVVAPYLWERSFRTVDVIALSHAHEDHIGGLPALVNDFHPHELWTGATVDSASWEKLTTAAQHNATRMVPLQSPAHFQYGGAEIQVLAPASDYVPQDTPKNNDSLVLRIRYGQHALLLCGDVERPIEQRMLYDGQLEAADILKVAHHGSRTSSTEEFLEAVNPIFAVISVGEGNSYGHPNRDVLERLNRRGIGVLRTDEDGLVSISTDGRRLLVNTNLLRSGL